jgi:hypothetical protein
MKATIKENLKQFQDNEEFKIDPQVCLNTLEKIKRGDKTGLTEIGDIDDYIENLRRAISQD